MQIISASADLVAILAQGKQTQLVLNILLKMVCALFKSILIEAVAQFRIWFVEMPVIVRHVPPDMTIGMASV